MIENRRTAIDFELHTKFLIESQIRRTQSSLIQSTEDQKTVHFYPLFNTLQPTARNRLG